MILFFHRDGGPFEAEKADETLNRVARKLAEGEKIYNFDAYIRGVAANVLKEYRREQPEDQAADGLQALPELPAVDSSEWERRRKCMEQCLKRLPPGSRALLTEYYQQGKGSRIKRRKKLAGRIRISPNALRLRVRKLQGALKACLQECLNRSAVGGE